jgi:hypothetical protein
MARFGAAILARFGREGKSDDAWKSRIFKYLGRKWCRLSAAIDDLGAKSAKVWQSRTVALWCSVGL